MENENLKFKNISIIPSFIVLLILISPFIIFIVLNSFTTNSPIDFEDYSFVSEVWWKNAESPLYITITRIAMISYVFTLGALGSFISILSHKNSKETVTLKALDSIILLFTGGTFAIILLLFFWGGLISGQLFPDVRFSDGMTIYIHTEFAKLGVWSFIAGFSERLLPQLINNIHKKVLDSENENNQK